MKYYKRLIENKAYNIIIAAIVLVFLGIFTCYIGIESLLDKGIKDSGISTTTVINNGVAGVIGKTNLGLVIIGIYLIYYGCITMPISSTEAQNPEEYEIKMIENDVYIKFRDYEFLIEKEKICAINFMFRDKNHKFVTLTRAYQIDNYVSHYIYKNHKNFKNRKK